MNRSACKSKAIFRNYFQLIRLCTYGMTLLEVTMSLAISTLVFSAGILLYSHLVVKYKGLIDYQDEFNSISVIDTQFSNDIHASVNLNGSISQQIVLTKLSGEVISYHLNLNGQVIRQVNGVGGEVVADSVRSFLAVPSADKRSVDVEMTFQQGNGENVWEFQYSIEK